MTQLFLVWDKHKGLRFQEGINIGEPQGLYAKINDKWRMRIRLWDGSLTWRTIHRDNIPKKMKLEALLQGVAL